MASWNRRANGYVYVYTFKDGKQVALPRAKVKHLDGDEDHNIEAWVAQYERQYEHKKIQPEMLLMGTDELSQYLQSYLAYMVSRKKAAVTIHAHEVLLRRWVLPFFLENDPPLRDPQQWPGRSIKMLSWLEAKGVTSGTILRCNAALRGFYSFLVDEGRIQTGIAIRLRRPVMEEQETPLNFTVKPEQVLEFAKAPTDPQVKLIALLGYFFSLRPQEIFALKKEDFRAGAVVKDLDCSKAMVRVKLYSKLAVNVTKQKRSNRTIFSPKAGSKGWVSCFSEEAAKMIVELLKEFEPDDLLFTTGNRRVFKKWQFHGLAGVTIKDLRRASLYWLGHFTDIQPMELMKHARHKRYETTVLYLRRPEEAVETYEELDLDA